MLAAVMVINTAAYTQDADIIVKMSELDKKTEATYGDAVILFREQSGRDIVLNYKNEEPLTKGMAALMTAGYLNLNDSFMYNLFGTERYAFHACVADGLMTENGSENDLMSGAQLLELMAKISARSGE